MKTKSEELFEEFLTSNNLSFSRIDEQEKTRTPDYLVVIAGKEIIFEIKELTEGKDYDVVKDPNYPHIKSSSRTVGDHVRRRIEGAKKQIQYGAKRGTPSILLIYNNLDSVFQDFGTEAMDFLAAMYGAYTVRVNIETRAMSELFHGKDQKLQLNKNTSFSAVGHLADRGKCATVTLYENAFAKVIVPLRRATSLFCSSPDRHLY